MIINFPMLISALVLSIINIKVFIHFAPKLGLLDIPCERKAHKGHVPVIGGMSVFIAFAVSLILYGNLNFEIKLVLIALSFMVFIGVLDDKYQLSVRARIIGQLLSASVIVFGLELYITSFGNLFGFGNISLGALGYIVTLLAILGAINAFNMIDGIDGLLGSISIVSFLGLFILGVFKDNTLLISVSSLIVFVLLPFVIANLGIFKLFKTKIFMGDAGSMFIGLLIVWLLIKGTNGGQLEVVFRPVFALYLIALPLMDMVAIMFRRIRKGQSPFHPDRNHIHHIFMRAGFSAKQALFFLVLLSLSMVLLGVVMEITQLAESVMFAVFFVLFLIYNYLIKHAWKVVKFSRRLTLQKRK